MTPLLVNQKKNPVETMKFSPFVYYYTPASGVVWGFLGFFSYVACWLPILMAHQTFYSGVFFKT